jgi:hypothetical protein
MPLQQQQQQQPEGDTHLISCWCKAAQVDGHNAEKNEVCNTSI